MFSKYINIPYKHLGRDFSGADCWGIIQLIYQKEKDILLPDNMYEEFWYKKENENPLLNGANKYNNKVEVSIFLPFDVIFFYNQKRSFVDHVGMCIEEDRFIHTYRNSSSRVDRIKGYWESRIWKGYRWQLQE